MILDIVTKFLAKEEILFVVSNFSDETSNSSDIDIYCITNSTSSVHLFYDENGRWVELFIDSISDLRKKIENVDEIAINFVHELKLVFGDQSLYSDLLIETSALREHYCLPQNRRNLLKYRIHVLLSKYLNKERVPNLAQEHFILNAISYPLVQLVLEYHHVFPSSPKRWLMQLENTLPEAEFQTLKMFLAHESDQASITAICEKYAGTLDPIHSEKTSNDNNLTFLS